MQQTQRLKAFLYIALAIFSTVLIGYFGAFFVAGLIRQPYRPGIPEEVQSRLSKVTNPGQVIWIDERFFYVMVPSQSDSDEFANTENETFVEDRDVNNAKPSDSEIAENSIHYEERNYDEVGMQQNTQNTPLLNYEVRKYDSFTQKFQVVKEISDTQIIGLQENKQDLGNSSTAESDEDEILIFCNWEIKEIEQADEFATDFNITNWDGEILFEINLHETIRPLNCSLDTIYATSAYSFMAQQFYDIDVSSSQISQNLELNEKFGIKTKSQSDTQTVEDDSEEDDTSISFAENYYEQLDYLDSNFDGYSIEQSDEGDTVVKNHDSSEILRFTYFHPIERFYVNSNESGIVYIDNLGQVGFYVKPKNNSI